MKSVSAIGLCALALVGLGAATSHAQTVTVSGPAEAPIGPSYEVTISVYLPQGVYENLSVDFALPTYADAPSAGWVADGIPADFTRVTQPNAHTHRYSATSVDLSAAAAFRTFKVRVAASPYYTVVKTPFRFTATLAGNVRVGEDLVPLDASGTHTTINTGVPNPAMYNGIWGGGAYVHEGVNGILLTYRIQAGTPNLLPLMPDPVFRWDLPAGIEYVRKNDTLFGLHTTPVSAPLPGETGGTVVHEGIYSELTSGAIDVFIPCSALPLREEDLEAWRVHATYDATNVEWVGDYDTGGPQPTTNAHFEADMDLAAFYYTLDATCGAGGNAYKHTYYFSNFGEQTVWALSASAPFGVPEIQNAMLVDLLPADVQLDGIYLNTSQIPAEFEAYACTLAAGSYINTAEFLAVRNTPACGKLNKANYSEHWVNADVTHLVLYAPSWTTGYFFIDTYIDIEPGWSAAHGNTVRNRLYFNGTYRNGGDTLTIGDQVAEEVAEDPWEYAGALSPFPSATDIYARFYNQSNYYLDANGGQGNFVPNAGYYGTGLAAQDPQFELTVPPGVIVDSFYYHPNLPCVDAGREVWSPLTQRPITWGISGTSTCAPQPIILFHLDPTYPFVHGEKIPFQFKATATGAVYPQGNVADLEYEAIVAEGMDVKLAVDCWEAGDGIPAGVNGSALYKVTSINRGQQDLSGISAEFAVPVNATFRGAEVGVRVGEPGGQVPVSAVLQYSTDGGNSWGAGPGPSVTHVRLTNYGIQGLGVSAIRPYFYVTVDANDPGATLSGSAVMSSTELGETPEKVTPFESGECPTTVVVQKFFDRNSNDVQDGGEESLGAGFELTLMAGGLPVQSATTNGSGVATFSDIAPGDYTVRETDTTSIEGTWIVQLDNAVTVPEVGLATTFGNLCECASQPSDPCLRNVCDPSGDCVEQAQACAFSATINVVYVNNGSPLVGWAVTISSGGSPVASGVTTDTGFATNLPPGDYTVTVTPPVTGQPVTWTAPTGQTQGFIIDGGNANVTFAESCGCNDNDACTLDTCDMGICSFAPNAEGGEACGICNGQDTSCSEGGWAFYVGVTGPGNRSGVIKCTLTSAGAPACDTTTILETVCE